LASTVQSTHKIVLGGREVQYTLRRSPKAKHTRFQISASSGFVVVVPRRNGVDDLAQLIESKKSWIFKNIDRYNVGTIPLLNKDVVTGDRVPYLGKDYELRLNDNGCGKCNVTLDSDMLLMQSKCDNETAATLKLWLRNQASVYFAKRAIYLAETMGCRYNRLFIRGQRSRWGSCSVLGNISLNWKLIMFPPHVIDYVIIHELAHLKVMGHSKDFWDVVAANCPDWRNCRQWLKQHDGYLSITI
jgi:predicted metal-dependent hydrolase